MWSVHEPRPRLLVASPMQLASPVSQVISHGRQGRPAIRHLRRRRGIGATIPERRDQTADRRRRGRLGGRPPTFDEETYRDRNVVERCFARLKQFRAIATRFDKLADRYRAGVVLASLILWLREPTR